MRAFTITALLLVIFSAVGYIVFYLWPQDIGGNKRRPPMNYTDFTPRRVVPPFPAHTKLKTRPVAEVKEKFNPDELVLGVTVGDESRAYLINTLTGPQREIFNDTLGGRAIAATW